MIPHWSVLMTLLWTCVKAKCIILPLSFSRWDNEPWLQYMLASAISHIWRWSCWGSGIELASYVRDLEAEAVLLRHGGSYHGKDFIVGGSFAVELWHFLVFWTNRLDTGLRTMDNKWRNGKCLSLLLEIHRRHDSAGKPVLHCLVFWIRSLMFCGAGVVLPRHVLFVYRRKYHLKVSKGT